MNTQLHSGQAIPSRDKEHDITADPHWTDNYKFPVVMRIRAKAKGKAPIGDYPSRRYKAQHPEFWPARPYCKRQQISGPRLVKKH